MKPELKRIEAALQYAATHVPVEGELTRGDRWSTVPLGDRASTSEFSQPDLPTPDLPTFITMATPTAESSRSALAHPALATSLLNDLGAAVERWSRELQEMLQQIGQLYAEGPIVDGWLESYENPDDESLKDYRLCGLGEDGLVWCRPCPTAQVSDVSFAIVRYQRLQALLAHKQLYEDRLVQLTEGLIPIHGKAVSPIANPSKESA
jgi:hypothetical protein